MAGTSEQIFIKTVPSLIIYKNEYTSNSIDLPINFNITNNDSIIIKELYIQLSQPVGQSTILSNSWYLSFWRWHNLENNGGAFNQNLAYASINSSSSLTIITVNDTFKSNYNYQLTLTTYNNNTNVPSPAPIDEGIIVPFNILMNIEMTINTKPTVSSGKIITSSDFIILSAYKGFSWNGGTNTSPTAGDKILTVNGNKVKPNTLSVGTPITAAWYNS